MSCCREDTAAPIDVVFVMLDSIADENRSLFLPARYPCKLCRTHLRQQLRDPSLGPVRTESRLALSTWMCELHNIVNKDIGKPTMECNAFKIDMMYLKDCGECEIKPKAEDNSGHHDYLGPWDRELYAADPRVLASAPTPSDVWEARDLSRLLDALETMAYFLDVEDEEDYDVGIPGPAAIAMIRRQARTGPAARRRWLRKLVNGVLPAAFAPGFANGRSSKVVERELAAFAAGGEEGASPANEQEEEEDDDYDEEG